MIRSPAQVVITGVGVTSPIGVGYDAVREALSSGESGVRRLVAFDSPAFPVRIGGEVVDFDARQYVSPRKSLKVMSRSIQLGYASAQMAATHAGLGTSGVSPERVGVVFGADMIHVEPDELVNAFRPCVEEGK